MRLLDYLAFALAVLLYLPRLALFYVYRLLIFISKPGSLYLLPLLLGGLLYWQYENIPNTWLYRWWVDDVVMRYLPHARIDQDYWYLGFFWCCFTFILYVLTGGKFQLLGTILSALPRVTRPFPPTLRLRLREKKIRPATVSLSVPSLKRRRGLATPDVTSGLSEPLKRLLEPHTGAEVPPAPPTPPETPPEEPEARPSRKCSEPQSLPPKAEA